MSGDYTRNTFKPEKQYSSVRQQQGRVHLDADWNEAADIATHGERTALGDVIGPTGMPEDAPGFGLAPIASGGAADLAIGPGRAWVGGLKVENLAAEPTTLTKLSGSGAGTVWEVSHGPRLAEGAWVGPAADPLSDPVQVTEVLPPEDGDGGRQRLKLAKGIGGGTKVVAAISSYGAQPHAPAPPSTLAAGRFLAYLDVWEREITALEDLGIRELALGGPDTALRTQVTWKVELLPLEPLIAAGDVGDPPVCTSFGPGWTPDGAIDRVRLAARTDPAEADPDPCVLPSAGGYRSLENHLYRVEVHRGGIAGQETILVKWSRDNAIHRTRLLGVADGSLVVEDTGKDDATGFKPGQWVEVLDERRTLRGEPGFFVELGEIVDTRIGIATVLDPVSQQPLVSNGEPDAAVLPSTGTVTRWEGGAPVEAKPGEWLPLESGVEVQLGAGLAHTGDHWLLPARSLTASLEWPADPASGEPGFEPPLGVVHGYCPLAVVERAPDGSFSVLDDCRPIFSPLTRQTALFLLGGDGQEAMPDLVGSGQGTHAPLDSPLRVGVARGRVPVAGRLVRFRVTDPNLRGRLSPGPASAPADVVRDTPLEVVVRTGGDGVAEAAFALDRRRHAHHVLAELLDASDPDQAERAHLPVHFTAFTSVAAEVAYDPDGCPYQSAKEVDPKPARTVQEALDRLCPRLELSPLGGDGQTLCAGKPAPAPLTVGLHWGRQPVAGVRVAFKVAAGDATVDPAESVTDAAGTVSTTLTAGQNTADNGGVVSVHAIPIDPPVPSSPDHLELTARFVNASCVYVGPEVCPDGQQAAGSNTVSALIHHLCTTGGRDPGIHVTGVFHLTQASEVKPLALDQVLTPEVLSLGLLFELDAAIDPAAVESTVQGLKSQPVGELILDLPYPIDGQSIARWWRNDFQPPRALFGFVPTRLDGFFTVAADRAGNDGHALRWTPAKNTDGLLKTRFATALEEMGLQNLTLEARAVLHGSRIWSAKDPTHLLDGELAANPDQPGRLVFPSGDGRRGGDLVLPFFVGRPEVVAPPVGPRDFLGLFAVTDAPFINALGASALNDLARAFDLALDRPALAAADLVPPDVAFDRTRAPDLAGARLSIRNVTLPQQPLRVLAHSGDRRLLTLLRRDLGNATQIQIEPVLTTAQDPASGIVERLRRVDPGVDAVLADAPTFTAIQADPVVQAKVGRRLVKI